MRSTHFYLNCFLLKYRDVLLLDAVGFLLYLSVVMSFISLIKTRVTIEAWSKYGFFRTKAKIMFGLHSTLALISKVNVLFFQSLEGVCS